MSLLLFACNTEANFRNEENTKPDNVKNNQEIEELALPALEKANDDVEEMKYVIDKAIKDLISREGAIKMYNDGIGKVLGQSGTLDSIKMRLDSGGDFYIRSMHLKAKAEATREISAKKPRKMCNKCND
ncbi:hypothetical protein BUE76_22095 [Cnuella takakiae]|nr:hypothetical protein BUE76_22095 [Cnuella takakiae]